MDAGCTSSVGQCGGGAADGADPATRTHPGGLLPGDGGSPRWTGVAGRGQADDGQSWEDQEISVSRY